MATLHYAEVFTLHSQIQIPILTPNYRKGIGIRARTQVRLLQCKWAITLIQSPEGADAEFLSWNYDLLHFIKVWTGTRQKYGE